MFETIFASPGQLLLGFVTGLVFGFLLQKGRVSKPQVLWGQFLLKDWTVVKIMGSAVVVGAVDVYAMRSAGWVQLEIKPAAFGGVVFGALLFGIGMAIFGLCPGTSVAACGEGRRDAMVGVLGMLFGAFLYVRLYSQWQEWAKALGDWGKVTLPQVTQTSPWLWIAGLVGAAVIAIFLLERNGRAAMPAKGGTE